MTQRIAPNNQLPATHFIECFYDHNGVFIQDKKPFKFGIHTPLITLMNLLRSDKAKLIKPCFIFRLRENKLPTKHKF